MTVAVITLTRDRTSHLANLVRGLERGDRHPDLLAVAVMGGDDPGPLVPAPSFPITWIHLDVDDGEPLPLAEARNRAAAAVEADDLVFLDVDCIPGPHLVGAYVLGLRELDGLLMGGVRYLGPGRPEGSAWDWDRLAAVAQRHPDRPDPPAEGLEFTSRYELFWSLTFAVRRATFRRLGGFDPSFGGYGGEDTDLAFAARADRVPIAWVADAWCLHQHHDTYEPPLDHAGEIVVNARRFHAKWGTWPMEDWLRRFRDLGVVEWRPDAGLLELVRQPTADELADAHRTTAVPSA